MINLESPTKTEVIYPDSDGKPMSDNTKQFYWITLIYHNLASLFATDNNVFIGGDLLWYAVEGNNKIRQAPNVMVVFGVAKGHRGSYMQWKEGNIAPQVVFEILSPGNTLAEMSKKQDFYNIYGVEEYYLYDPDKNDLTGWVRIENNLRVIEEMNNWVSPRLGIRFDLSGEELQIYHPNGNVFYDPSVANQQLEIALERAILAEKEANKLAEKLRSLGIDPEAIN